MKKKKYMQSIIYYKAFEQSKYFYNFYIDSNDFFS